MKSIASLYRNAYSGLPKNIWLLGLVMLINRSGTMVVAFLTLYVTQKLLLSPKFAGIAIAVYGAGAVLGAFFGGKLTDKFGHQPVQVIALIGGGILFILTSFISNFQIFCGFIFALACVNESFRPANTSAVAANTDSGNRTRSFALLRLAMNIGWSVGTSLGGILSHYDYVYLFWVDGFTSILAGISLIFLKFNTAIGAEVNGEVDVKEDVKPLYNKAYMFFISGTLLFTFCFFQLFTNIPLFYKVGLHLDERLIGFILAMNGIIIALFEMILVRNFELRFTTKSIILVGTFLMALFFFFSSGYNWMQPIFVAVFGMLMITFSEMLALPFMNSYFINFAGKHNVGSYSAVYTISWSIGQILAGFVGGTVIDSYGFGLLWLLCAIFSMLSFFIYSKAIH